MYFHCRLSTSASVAALADPPLGAGSLDPDNAPMLTSEGTLSLAVPASGGEVLVAGKFDFLNGAAGHTLMRLRADGTAGPDFTAALPPGVAV